MSVSCAGTLSQYAYRIQKEQTWKNYNILTGIKDPADHPGENHEKHGQQLQVAT